MRLTLPFGYELSTARTDGAYALALRRKQQPLRDPSTLGWRRIWDTFAGEWQQDDGVDTDLCETRVYRRFDSRFGVIERELDFA